jgi:hypothetical protein
VSGFSKTVLMTEKTAVFTPMPTAITMIAMMVKPGVLWSAWLEMCQWIRETLDKESIWDEVRSTSLSRW